MKKIFTPVLMLFVYSSLFSQWQLSLTMKQDEAIAGISSPTNNIIWTVTNNFFIYRTNNGGNNWKRIKCNGLTTNISFLQLYVLNASTAFLSVDKNTGVGPGLIYRTTDSGRNWVQVFIHEGTCDIVLGMFDDDNGIMSCSFSSFNGSIPSGQILYTTSNGGIKWKRDSINPAGKNVMNLEVKNRKVAITDYKYFYYSPDRGTSFPLNDRLPNASSPKRYLQFEDSNYGVLSSDNIVDILVKRPGTGGWIDEHVPPGIDNGAITAIVLDGNECWITEAFDTNKLYYSSDSAKTFTPTVPLQNSSFQFLIKARNGKTLIGGVPSFMSGKIYINKRDTFTENKPLNQNKKVITAVQ